MIRLGMDLGRDGLEHEHDSVASHDGPEVVGGSVASALIKNVEAQLGLIEGDRCAQIVNDEEGSNSVQHGESRGLEYSLCGTSAALWSGRLSAEILSLNGKH